LLEFFRRWAVGRGRPRKAATAGSAHAKPEGSGEDMKGLLLGATILGAAAVLGGCPIYPDTHDNQVCGAECCSSSDCGSGYACTLQGQCVPWGQDAAAGGGECGECPMGYLCTLSAGLLQCLPPNAGQDASLPASEDSGNGTMVGAAGDAAAAVDAASDAAGSLDGGIVVGELCNADAQCDAGGAKCVDGLCTSQGQLCSDGTQCLVAGDACVDGLCIPRCGGSNSTPCPTGYACDFNRGVCSVNPGACTTDAQCQGGAACVETRCVAPCAPADAGAECATGQVCVNGGCIPDEQAQFTCKNDGSSGTTANTCPASSVCLHGDCYASCGGDGGGCLGAGESCKSVRIPKGTYAVCATASNLGSECDPAVGDYCANAGVCIDGYCK
jgi:hypothetical protein